MFQLPTIMFKPNLPHAPVLLLMCLFAASVMAQPGTLDPSFNTIDPAWGDGSGFNGEVMAQALQPDGSIIVSGDFTAYNGTPVGRIVRLRPDGVQDPSFDAGLGFSGSVVGYVHALALQPDGKVIVGGAFDQFNEAPCDNIVRLNADGSLDASFVTPLGSGNNVLALVLQADGHILLGGNFPGNLMRLNADGSADATFDTGGAFAGGINAIALQPDGRMIVGGAFGDYNGTGPAHIVRLNADGSHDPSFSPAFGFDSFVNCIALVPDGDVYVGGDFLTYDGISRPHLARLNADGTLDAAFECDPAIPASSTVYALSVVPNGTQYWVAVGGTFSERFLVCQANGDTNYQFYWLGVEGQYVSSIVRQPDGAFLLGGVFDHTQGEERGNHVRVMAYGMLDINFNYAIGLQQLANDGYNGQVNVTVLQPDGKVLVGGHFDAYNSVPCPHLIRLHSDGTRDLSFTPPEMWVVRSLLFQPDGRLLVGGDGFLLRLMSDGSPDPSFDPGSSASVRTLALQTNGRILVGGGFTAYNGVAKPGLVRLLADGTIDDSFDLSQLDPDNMHMQYVNAILVQSDGKVVIGGQFSALGETIAGSIQRLNANGSLDHDFDTGWGLDAGYPGSGEVVGLFLYPDGRVLAYGSFSYYNNDHHEMDGIPRNGIALLNTDGSLDMGFNPQGANHALLSMIRLPGGGFMVGGDFTEVDGQPREKLARLLPDGSLDASFDPGEGVQGWYDWARIYAMALQPDGNLIIAGEFNTCNGVFRSNIARVFGSSTGCLPTQLTTTADPVISCGAVNLKLNGTSTIAATDVPGANKYQFRFTNIPGQPNYARNIALPTRSFTLTKWYTNPLKAGRTYDVVVRASFDDGATWCDWGPSCTVKVDWFPLAPAMVRGMEEGLSDAPELLLFPNPTNGDQLRITMHGADPLQTTARIDLVDLYGKRVMTATLPLQDGRLDTVLPMIGELSIGMYIVTITAGDHVFNERLVIAR
jgi:uncharacterized delta-60 repeat protein